MGTWAKITANIPAAAIKLFESNAIEHDGTFARDLASTAISAAFSVLGLQRRNNDPSSQQMIRSAETLRWRWVGGEVADRCVSSELRSKVVRRLTKLQAICEARQAKSHLPGGGS